VGVTMSAGDGLSDKALDRLQALLVNLRKELEQQERGSAGWRAPVELDQQSVGRLSRMDAMQQQAMSEAEGRRRQNDLLRIDAAFVRMETQEYGWCNECGEAIVLERMEVDPMATHCVRCAK